VNRRVGPGDGVDLHMEVGARPFTSKRRIEALPSLHRWRLTRYDPRCLLPFDGSNRT
jgi:hypothetical protein